MAVKVGTEDKKKVVIAAALLVAVVIIALFQLSPFFSSKTEPTEVAATVTQVPMRTATQPGAPAGAVHEAEKVPAGSMAALDPTLHPEWMTASESLEYAGKGRNIFSLSSAPVDIPKPAPPRPEPVAVGPPPPPPPPPIDLKFFGYEAHNGGDRKAFLLHGDDVFIAAAGDVVDHRYKVVAIAPMSIQVEDIPFNNTQTLPLVQN